MTIDLNLSSEQSQIVASLRSMLSDGFPVARLRMRGPDFEQDANALKAIADFGAFGLFSADETGASDLSVVEEVLLHIEFGRHLVTPGALAAAVAARFAAQSSGADFEAIASGEKRICLANALRPAALDAPEGEPLMLFDWEGCGLGVLWNETGAVLVDIARLRPEAVPCTDRNVSAARAVLSEDAIVAHVSSKSSRLPRIAQLLVAAQLLGITEATRDMAVGYAGIRSQFGQTIGSFQAVKHRCANMAINAEVLSAQLAFAAIAERDDWEDADFQGAACRQIAARNALENAASNIQVHGGIGFSAESDAHLYLLRAHLLENIGGPPRLAEKQFLDCPPPLFALHEGESF